MPPAPGRLELNARFALGGTREVRRYLEQQGGGADET